MFVWARACVNVCVCVCVCVRDCMCVHVHGCEYDVGDEVEAHAHEGDEGCRSLGERVNESE